MRYGIVEVWSKLPPLDKLLILRPRYKTKKVNIDKPKQRNENHCGILNTRAVLSFQNLEWLESPMGMILKMKNER